MGEHGSLPPRLADGRQAEGHRPRPADDGRRGGRLRPRGRRAEDRRAADEPRRGRAPGDAVRRRDRRRGFGGGGSRHADAAGRPAGRPPGRRTGRRTAPACRWTRPSPSASPRRAARPTPTSTTTRRARRAPRRCSGDRARAGPGGRRHADGPARPIRSPATTSSSALRLDQHIPGLVDGYFGPADLKAQVDMEQLRAPARLRDDAAALRDRLPAEVAEPDRRAWLDAQLVALETQAAALAGDDAAVPRPRRRAASRTRRRGSRTREFEAAAAAIDGAAPRRRARWPTGWRPGTPRFVIAVDRLPRGRRLAGRALPGDARPARSACPTARTCGSRSSRGQPWSAYNWYDGGRRSRIDVNTDLPVRAPDLVGTGRPRDVPRPPPRARLEGGRAGRRRRAASSRRSCSSTRPSASSARAWPTSASASRRRPPERVDLLVELFERAGPAHRRPIRPRRARRPTRRGRARRAPRTTLGAIRRQRGAPAPRRRAVARRGRSRYLRDVGRYSPAVAEKRLEFIEHPLWRTYVFVYAEGEALLGRWLDAVPESGAAGAVRAAAPRAADAGRRSQSPG